MGICREIVCERAVPGAHGATLIMMWFPKPLLIARRTVPSPATVLVSRWQRREVHRFENGLSSMKGFYLSGSSSFYGHAEKSRKS